MTRPTTGRPTGRVAGDLRVLWSRIGEIAPVAVGLVLVGTAAYGILAVAGHVLGPREYAAVASTYLLITIAGTGVFTAVEQETNRAASARLAHGATTHPVVRASATVSAGLTVVVCAVVVLTVPLWVDRVLGGSWGLTCCVLLGIVGAATLAVLRGVFGAERRYGWYAGTVAGEGLARLALLGVLLLVGTVTAVGLGLVFAAGTVLATVTVLPGLRLAARARRRGTTGVSPAESRGVTDGVVRGVGFLVGASTLTFLMANFAPVAVTSRLVDEAPTAAAFASAFMLCRIPLFLFFPAQAFLLPALTAAVAAGDAGRARRQLTIALGAVAAVGTCGAAGAVALGPWIARVGFGAQVDLPWPVFALLAASTAVMMAAQVMQPALVAFDAHRFATASWATGAAVLVVVLYLPVAALGAAVAAQIVAPLVVAVTMAAGLRVRLRGLVPAARPVDALEQHYGVCDGSR